MSPVCPDPRGPLVDRVDFLEGQIDALTRLKAYVEETIGDVLEDPDFSVLRMALDPSFTGNTTLDQFAADLEAVAMDVRSKVDGELVQARWKLAKARKAEGATP